MEKEDRITSDMPTTEQIETELRREVYRRDYSRVLMSTIGGLVTVAAAAVLIAVLLLPVLQIFGRSMSPTLREGDIVLSLKTGDFRTGDVVAFYYNNKILVKRVIAGPGDWVDLDEDGTVYVNQAKIEEVLGREFDKTQYTTTEAFEGLLRGAGNVTIDMVYYPDINVWNGRESMQYIVKDYRIHS